MTATAAALKRARTVRLELDATVDAATRDLAQAWSGAWEEIADEWAQAVDELLSGRDGVWPSRATVLRAQRARRAMDAAREALDELAKTSGVRILRDVSPLASAAAVWEERIALAQLADGVSVDWTRVDEQALKAIVKRSTTRVEAATRRLPREQAAVMKQVLIRGVAVGDNPRTAASLMLKRLGGAFDGGRRRAETIARTELLDAHRYGARASRMANADTLKGWQWLCALSARTCPACLGQHGQVFPVDEPGPLDHVNGRCTAVPVTKSMRELGFDVDDPADALPDAKAWFDAQPEQVQADMMGAERLRRLKSGDLAWDDLAVRRENPDWRASFVVRPLGA